MSSTDRIERLRQNYINTKPTICYERARIFTESHKRTEGQPTPIRRAQAFYDFCNELDVKIFEDELIVGTTGNFRRTGILTPEYSWTWVDREMDQFDKRPQDPYEMSDEQRAYVRENIFPYWQDKSLEEIFLAQIPENTAKIAVDTGIIDNDSKWRQAVGEITPDYEDVLFKKGFKGILKEAEENLAKLDDANANDLDKIIFYKSVILTSKGIIKFAKRYSEKAKEMAQEEKDEARKQELLKIAEVCNNVPENPPTSFHEAVQFVWFTQLGGIISENPLALNLGRFDQYMYPYLEKDLNENVISENQAQELVEALWLKLSEWVWTISSNTAGFFAGYNQFQNLTVGGKTRDGLDATNKLSYMCLDATQSVKTHQPGLSVRIHTDCPQEFLDAVCELVSQGTGFPAIHNDQAGTQMLLQAGYEPEDARDWNNCGCVVPHFRKTGEWTSAVNINFAAALEYTLNEGKSRLDNEFLGLKAKPVNEYKTFEDVKEDFLKQQENLIKHSVISTILAQKLHTELVPRPFLSSCVDGCMDKGVDLANGGAHYNVGPVLTGIGLAVVSNSLAVIKSLVFEQQVTTLEELNKAMDANWIGYDDLREKALAVPKYGNDNDYVDSIAIEIANHYYRTIRSHKDIFGSPFNSAFMGISNYIPTGRVIGATPCGRKAKEPLAEGVSPFTGSDVESPLAAMRSSAKLNHDVHTGGTLLNLRLNEDLVKTDRGKRNLGSLIRSYFSLGAFHVQFNTVSTEVLRKAQKNPEQYKDLLVRVAGYSTQFINLSPEMQKAIIDRNAHSSF
ncbi:pyruvate formate-lyase/glycerol dehydratase family glycyl radical enzyme [Bacilli bacterium PM5-3]|nr:pyruvate formate-lyase/glycerol dehydratase family glycyl radical enzyme [Bacilli bacterium PM5-3]MDH6603126.1 pyruvate formate-lyase/glycerol dehydratase family glycyl radical enzyme [Bacilli bacterium PM5-9]